MKEDLNESRRRLLKSAGVAGAAFVGASGYGVFVETRLKAQPQPQSQPQPQPAAQAPAQEHMHAHPATVRAAHGEVLAFFTDEEARFVAAAVERLIPADEQWPGAEAAGVLVYIDRQLASAYGTGARMYLEGPWDPDAPPQQGYQLRYSPAQLYRVAIAEIRPRILERFGGREFWDLDPGDMDAILAALESGRLPLPSLPSAVFFETLLANTVEGFFSDPVYGGNRDMIGWRLVGFPGAFAQYLDLVDAHGFVLQRPPIGISNAEQVLGAGPV